MNEWVTSCSVKRYKVILVISPVGYLCYAGMREVRVTQENECGRQEFME